MKYLLFILLMPSFAYATTCVRTDNSTVEGLEGVDSAEIFHRKYDFNSRIRFYNQDKQVETCSTNLGSKGNFDCWVPAGSQGQYDDVWAELVVSSDERSAILSNYKQAFNLSVTPVAGKKSATFVCTP